MGQMQPCAPATPAELHDWIRVHLGVRIARSPVIHGHAAPFDYVVHTFFEGEFTPGDPADCVVWANRGGGKTFLGAVATALDLAFKPGITIRILAGSLEQAGRMHEHLRMLFARERLASIIEGRITDRRLRVRGGGSVELLAQSQASVRGTRVQKLRCDEVELFDPDVWEAAQLTTKSRRCGRFLVRGGIECLSTMHIPHGLMYRLVNEDSALPGRRSRTVFKWGALDVMSSCVHLQACRDEGHDGELNGCALAPDCDGSAKLRHADQIGHLAPEDALAMRSRVSAATWESEMLCLRPRRHDAVLPEFDPSRHVVSSLPDEAERWLSANAGDVVAPGTGAWLGGMDFGFRAPMAMLWAYLDTADALWITAERIEAGVTLPEHVRAIIESPWPRPSWLGVDPAGCGRNSQTGRSDVAVLREAGFDVRTARRGIQEGLMMIRARLKPADTTQPRLFIHQRCGGLIESMERYHYPTDRPNSSEPVKDGFDHAIDALRYLVVNLDGARSTSNRNYLR